MAAPLSTIPIAWAARGACPLCGASPLTLEPPDRLACGRCGLAFEVEAGGARLHLVRLPAQVQGAADAEWRTAAEVRGWLETLVQAGCPSAQVDVEPVPPLAGPPAEPAMPTPAEARAQARGLFALGHSLPQIDGILRRSGVWSPEQIAAALAELEPLVAAGRARQRRQAWLLAGLGFGLIAVVLTGLAIYLSLLGASPAVPAPPATVGAAGAGNWPAALQTLVPPGARLVNPTPAVQRLTGAAAAGAHVCPQSPEEAAGLFGGLAKDWRYDQASAGWLMFSALDMVTVQVPAKMVAGYMRIGESLDMVQVDGPATISGVNMIVITCE